MSPRGRFIRQECERPAAQVRLAGPGDRDLATVANADILVLLGQDAKNLNLSVGG